LYFYAFGIILEIHVWLAELDIIFFLALICLTFSSHVADIIMFCDMLNRNTSSNIKKCLWIRNCVRPDLFFIFWRSYISPPKLAPGRNL